MPKADFDCKGCGARSEEDFYPYKKSWCKKCWTAKTTKYRAEHKKKYPKKNRHWDWTSKLKYHYGITPDEYNEMLDAQGGVCATCLQPETAVSRKSGEVMRLAVDHCHGSGKVRGLLCVNCNQALGKVRDNCDTLERMITYLRSA